MYFRKTRALFTTGLMTTNRCKLPLKLTKRLHVLGFFLVAIFLPLAPAFPVDFAADFPADLAATLAPALAALAALAAGLAATLAPALAAALAAGSASPS